MNVIHENFTPQKKSMYTVIPDTRHPDHPRFHWEGQAYQFHYLLFGLSCAPRLFTKGHEASGGLSEGERNLVDHICLHDILTLQ